MRHLERYDAFARALGTAPPLIVFHLPVCPQAYSGRLRSNDCSFLAVPRRLFRNSCFPIFTSVSPWFAYLWNFYAFVEYNPFNITDMFRHCGGIDKEPAAYTLNLEHLKMDQA